MMILKYTTRSLLLLLLACVVSVQSSYAADEECEVIKKSAEVFLKQYYECKERQERAEEAEQVANTFSEQYAAFLEGQEAAACAKSAFKSFVGAAAWYQTLNCPEDPIFEF